MGSVEGSRLARLSGKLRHELDECDPAERGSEANLSGEVEGAVLVTLHNAKSTSRSRFKRSFEAT
jgi:hypothetical protein